MNIVPLVSRRAVPIMFAGVVGLLANVWVTAGAAAINLSLSRADIERALALGRWPYADAERARFHARYIVPVDGPSVEYFAVHQVEVITEFRRLELIAEEHARLNDLFGRGGLRDVEEAMRPWRGRVSIVVHFLFDLTKFFSEVPAADVVLEGADLVLPISVRRSEIYSGGDQPSLIGGLVEALFDANAVGQGPRPVVVRWNGVEAAHVIIEFGQLE